MTNLEHITRKFLAETHIKNLLKGEWIPAFDENGNQLPGIKGRVGVAHLSAEGKEIGVDLFEMQPESHFPLHTHDGDHILYGISGKVYVSVDGKEHIMNPGDSVFIPAEYPHGVKTIPNNNEPAQFLAFGYPHKHVSALDRMRLVKDNKPSLSNL